MTNDQAINATIAAGIIAGVAAGRPSRVPPTVTEAELVTLDDNELVRYMDGQHAAARAARRARNHTDDPAERDRLNDVRFTAMANADAAWTYRANNFDPPHECVIVRDEGTGDIFCNICN